MNFSPDGAGLDPNASAALHLTDDRVERLPYGRSILALSRDGRRAVALDPASPEDKVPLLLLEEGRLERVNRPERIREWGRDPILIHPDGGLAWYTRGYDTWKAALAEYDCRKRTWTVTEAPPLSEVTKLVFGATPGEFYGVRADHAVIWFRLGQPLREVGQGTDVDYCPEGGLAYLAPGGRSIIVQPPGGTRQRVLRGPGTWMNRITWSPEGRFVAYDYELPYNYWLSEFGLGICRIPAGGIGVVEVATGRNYAVVPSPLVTDLRPVLSAYIASGGGGAPRLEGSFRAVPTGWVAELDPGLRQTLVRLEGAVAPDGLMAQMKRDGHVKVGKVHY